MKYAFWALIWGLMILSCEKKDTTKPTISFLEPSMGDTVTIGTDSLHIEFKISDDNQLANYSFVVKDTGNVKYTQGGAFVSAKEYFHHSHKTIGGFSGLQKMFLTVQVYDKSYNATEVTNTFYIKP